MILSPRYGHEKSAQRLSHILRQDCTLVIPGRVQETVLQLVPLAGSSPLKD